jgi:SAM-dependent methyltransferase
VAATTRTLYWPGNAAKAFVVDQILRRHDGRPFTVLDHGCGRAVEWLRVLDEHPEVSLVGWDPDVAAAEAARAALSGRQATIHAGALPAATRADVVVSFSVLEHVHDKPSYLAQARRALGPGGDFYLNYDDGHFRVVFDTDDPRSSGREARRWLHNVVAPLLARMGRTGGFQRRVSATEGDRLVRDAGFRIERVWYHNVLALKALAKTIPPDRAQEFVRMWVDFEERLNDGFGDVRLPAAARGDDAALWQIAGSRTMLLRAT